MKSKKSLFSISPVLVKNALRPVLWPGTAAVTMLYVLGKSGDLSQIPRDPVSILLQFFYPIFAAVLVFSYLHRKNAAQVIHSLPANRKTIFQSHALTGWIISVLPILTSAFCLCLYNADRIQEMFLWLGQGILTTTFVYSLAVLAAVIAGNTVIHVLLAAFLNGIAPALVYMTNEYLRFFMKGMAAPPVASISCSPLFQFYWVDPYTYLPEYVLTCAAIYLAIAVLAFCLAEILYHRIKIEDAGNPVFFPVIGEGICILIAFFGMTIFGFYGMAMRQSVETVSFLICSFIGALLFYLIARMILEKRLRVFHLQTLKGFAVFLLAAGIFCAFTVFDVTGFEKRVPKTEDIASVVVENAICYDSNSCFSEKKSIKSVTALHKLLTQYAEDRYITATPYESGKDKTYCVPTILYYTLKNGRKMIRQYAVYMDKDDPVYKAYEKLYESKEYQESLPENISPRTPFQDALGKNL